MILILDLDVLSQNEVCRSRNSEVMARTKQRDTRAQIDRRDRTHYHAALLGGKIVQ